MVWPILACVCVSQGLVKDLLTCVPGEVVSNCQKLQVTASSSLSFLIRKTTERVWEEIISGVPASSRTLTLHVGTPGL